MNCRVVVEAAVPVYDVETEDEAVRISISKIGDMLNPDLNYVEINVADRECEECGAALEPAFIAADEGLVALELEMKVFNIESAEHASRVARKEIGQRLSDIPLTVAEVEEIEEELEEVEDEAEEAVDDVDTAVETETESEAETEIEEVASDVDDEEIPELDDIL
ncbi:MAG: DUF555 domain-containing protein [Halobacteriales archaeon]